MENILLLRRQKTRRWLAVFVSSAGLLCAFSVLSLMTGYIPVSGGDFLSGMRKIFFNEHLTRNENVLFYIRAPRLFAAVLVGSSLCVSGVVFQALFRNPLADSYVIGVSSGAAFGATLSLSLGMHAFVPQEYSLMLFAFLGAGLSLLIVYRISLYKGRLILLHLLLSGVIVGIFFSGLVTLLLLFGKNETKPLLFWLLGGVSQTFWKEIDVGAVAVVLGMAIILRNIKPLHAILIGEEAALSLGADVHAAKKWLLVGGAMLTSAAVSLGGVIGFVGIIVPHMLRMIAGNDVRFLVSASFVAGGAFLVGCDILSRSFSVAEIPLGVITTFLGVPFFLALLLLKKGKYHF